jgi:hypothetical protein
MPPPDFCPNCGAEVSWNSKACRECGSCEATGWSEVADDQPYGTGYGEEQEFDYDEYVRQEFDPASKVKPQGLSWFWWVAGILLILAMVGAYL